MARRRRTLEAVLRGGSDANIDFDSLCQLLLDLGFAPRHRGGHHMFTRDGVPELINLQREGRHAKPYQVRQIRRIITQYGIVEPD